MKIRWDWKYIKSNYPKTYEKLLDVEELFEEQNFLVDILEKPFDFLKLREFFKKVGVFYALVPQKRKALFSKENRIHWDIFLYKIDGDKIIYFEQLKVLENYPYEYVEVKALLESLRICENV